MAGPRIAPYGSWRSPVTSDLIVSGSIGLGQIALDGDDVYWVEMRPAEGGRNVIVRRTPDGRTVDMTPPAFNARTRVHEYGGGAYTVWERTIYFANFDDQRVYRQLEGGPPQPMTPEGYLRYADGVIDWRRGRMICVREEHGVAGHEAVNTLASVDLEREEQGDVLVSGSDFYSSPTISDDGRKLAWLAWDHPNMPWDGTELWSGEFDSDGSLSGVQRVAGGRAESIFQPEWSPDGALYFVSDTTGWWNLYRWHDGDVEPLCRMEAEFGRPQWVFGAPTYALESPGRLICSYTRGDKWHLASLDTSAKRLEPIQIPHVEMSRGEVRARAGRVVFLAGAPDEPYSIIQLELGTGEHQVLQRSSKTTVEEGYLSRPEAIEFPTERGRTANAFFYAPTNPDYRAPDGERPPMLVMSHGGPTDAAAIALNLHVQYWTSRGIAVLDVNYGGSSGYGTEYRRRLNGQWGIVDVDDCVNGARYLSSRGDVDGERMAIRGGSAGGYTTLSALTFRDVFKAGASYYGVSDLEALARDTHKFESRYLDTMIGPYPERRDLYVERSPIYHTERLSCPVILFQGLEDRIVPPNQAEMMLAALREKGVPVAYVSFEGEQHGFRRSENIKRALEAELYFYSRVFGFDLADPVQPVPIENL